MLGLDKLFHFIVLCLTGAVDTVTGTERTRFGFQMHYNKHLGRNVPYRISHKNCMSVYDQKDRDATAHLSDMQYESMIRNTRHIEHCCDSCLAYVYGLERSSENKWGYWQPYYVLGEGPGEYWLIDRKTGKKVRRLERKPINDKKHLQECTCHLPNKGRR